MSNLQQTTTYSISWGTEYKGLATAPKTLIEMLERAVAGGRGIVHIKSDGSEVYQSYEELLTSAQRVLGALRARGLQPGDKLILEVQDSYFFLPVFWGCILGGFVAAPMHTPSSFKPESNEMRKTKIVWELLHQPMMVCDKYLEEQYLTLQEHPAFAGLQITSAEALLQHEPDENYRVPRPDDIAFLQFSSGSTGNAKGVELSHEKIIYNCGSFAECYEHSPEDVFVNWMPLYHDMGLICFHLMGVLNGLKQVKMSHDTFLRRPELLLRKITEHKGTITGSPNFGLEWMTMKVNDLSSFDLSSLRILYDGAEPISVLMKEAFEEKFSACGLKTNVVNYVYGMAEAVVGSVGVPYGEKADVFHRIDQKMFNGQGIAVPVTDLDTPHVLVAEEGLPFPGMGIRIVDDNDEVLPEGHVGHIQKIGPNVTTGYYNNPEANANLFCGEWIRSGDLGFMMNGRISVTGRMKDVIFINAQNFFAHDIEELLIHEFGMQNQTVVAVGFTDQKTGRERVYIFVKFKLVNDDFLKLAQDIKSTVNVEMGFEIDGVIPLKSIPKTTSGKLERYNLRNRLIEGEFDELLEDIRLKLIEKSNTRNDHIMPRTETEKVLHEIWQRILFDVPVISVNDHFMALGGDSLTAMDLVFEMEETFGITNFDMIHLNEYPTIEKLAKYIEQFLAQGTGETVAEKTSIRETVMRNAEAGKTEYELSRSQRGLWFIQEMNPDTVAYNEHYLLQINGNLDVIKFGQTLREIVERHAVLRTVFVERDGLPKQIVLDQVSFELPLFDADNLPEDDALKVVEKTLHEDLSTPFDLSKGPLCHFKLFRISEHKFCFYLVAHHIIMDGLSTDVLFREMSAIYSAKMQDQPSPLPQMEVQYADFAEWQQEQLNTPKFRKMEEYWLDSLTKPLPVLELPIDFPRPPRNSHDGTNINYPLSEKLTQELLQLSERTNVSLYMVMLSAYFVWLNSVTHDKDIIVGTSFSGRTERELQDLIGYFINAMPIRVKMDGIVTFHDVLNRVRVRLLEGMANQEYPFDLLVEAVNPERDLSRPVLYSTIFDFLIPPITKMGGLEMALMDSRKVNSISDLTWNVIQKQNQNHLQFEVVYNVTLFQPETIQRFIGEYENILQLIVQDLDAPIPKVEMEVEFDLDDLF